MTEYPRSRLPAIGPTPRSPSGRQQLHWRPVSFLWMVGFCRLLVQYSHECLSVRRARSSPVEPRGIHVSIGQATGKNRPSTKMRLASSVVAAFLTASAALAQSPVTLIVDTRSSGYSIPADYSGLSFETMTLLR